MNLFLSVMELLISLNEPSLFSSLFIKLIKFYFFGKKERQKFLKTPADVSRLNSYLHECSNNIEQRNLDHFKRIITELDDNYQSYSSQGIDCNCVFCGRQKLSSMRQNQSVGVDTRNFINGLNEHRTTVKVQRGFEKYPNMITDES